jgi:hypothetical protein
MVISARGYLSSSDPAVVLPLGREKTRQIEIQWPLQERSLTRISAEFGRNQAVLGQKR